jgi:hypothetical protein
MKCVRRLCESQRGHMTDIISKQDTLRDQLGVLRSTTASVIKLLGDLQAIHEECLDIGVMLCSKVQHAVSVSDRQSLAVAGSVAAIDAVRVSFTYAERDQISLQGVCTEMHKIGERILIHQTAVQQDLKAMSNAHSCAVDVHAPALVALRNGMNPKVTEAGLCCTSCGMGADPVYAARTGLCKTCHENDIEATNVGWSRCP